MQQLLFGLFLGWGAAIPIGPINLEVIRRNLTFGTRYGVALGLGACSADVTYLLLLSVGFLTLLTQPLILKIMGCLGSLILAWFGYSTLRMKTQHYAKTTASNTRTTWRHSIEGYLLTLINPMTILFWSSVSTQIVLISKKGEYAIINSGLGVLLGTLSWILGLNLFLHLYRHRLSEKTLQIFNKTGGIILLAFAIHGLWHTFK